MIAQLLQKKASFIRLIQSDGFKKYFTNTSWLLVDNVVTLAIGLVVSVFVARYLGPSDFGLLSFAKSVAKLFTIFCALGLERIVIRNLIYDQKNYASLLGTALTLKLSASLLANIAFAIIGFMLLERSVYWLVLVLTLAAFFEAFTVIRYYFASRVEARYISRIVLIKIIISAGVKLLLVYYEFPLIYFAIEILLEAVLAMAGYLWVYHQRSTLPISQWKFDKIYSRSLMRDSWPLLVSSFVIFIYTETDVIIIKYMLGNEAVGHYSIAVRMTTIWYLAGTVICNSLFPAILNAKKIDEFTYRKRLIQLLRLLIAIAITIALLVTVCGSYLIEYLFGTQYAAALPALMVLTWSLLFVYLGIAGTQWYIAENLQKYMLVRSVAGAIANIILNILLIPSMGILGASIATLISQMTAAFLANSITSQTRELFRLQLHAIFILKK